MPKVDLDLPKVDMPKVDMPKVDLDLPKVDVDMPKVDLDLPKIDLDLPKVDMPKVDVTAARAGSDVAASTGSKRDDLTLIEGIGPKIAGLLRNVGIHTFRQLSETNSERLQQILDDGGPNFKRANPGTWPEQARLAADGLMNELKALQDSLTGGIRR